MSDAAPSAPVAPFPHRAIDVVEIVDIVFAEDCSHIALAVRADDGNVIVLRTPRAALTAAFARLSRTTAMDLAISIERPAAKLSAPVGEWEVVQNVGGAIPTFELRTSDGRGIAVGFTYDQITAIPRVQVAVDL